jgi:hypothetical protein
MANRIYPNLAYITDITNEVEAVVTFSEDHDFTIAEIISFRVTRPFGMVEINNKQGKVLSKTPDTITVDINTSTWTPFSIANLNEPKTTPPTCLPSASGVITDLYTPTYTLFDAFDNIRI